MQSQLQYLNSMPIMAKWIWHMKCAAHTPTGRACKFYACISVNTCNVKRTQHSLILFAACVCAVHTASSAGQPKYEAFRGNLSESVGFLKYFGWFVRINAGIHLTRTYSVAYFGDFQAEEAYGSLVLIKKTLPRNEAIKFHHFQMVPPFQNSTMCTFKEPQSLIHGLTIKMH